LPPRMTWQRQGFHSFVAVIALPNEPSVRLPERHGLVLAGRLVEAGYQQGAWRDVGFWQRTFNIAG
jgi:phosphinothricin acetyltransferase